MPSNHERPLAGLPYYGGKSPRGRLGPWIAGLLPHGPRVPYVEPFGGMAGVLLCREPSRIEILNDANGHIVTWWTVVRDRPDEIARAIRFTPHSRALYEEAVDALASTECELDDLAVAHYVYVLLTQGMTHSVAATRGGWRRIKSPNAGMPVVASWPEMVPRLAERLRHVQLECRDALALLEWTAGDGNVVVYVDPPYRTANRAPYGKHRDVDWDRLAELLAAQSGRCAVSGYRDEWDRLGWRRHERATHVHTYNFRAGQQHTAPRVEVLWTNYETSA